MVERTITATIAAHPDCGVAMWAPRRLRDMSGFQMTAQRLDDDLVPVDKKAAVALDRLASEIAHDVAQERARGVKTLIMSEENLMGGMRNNFRTKRFYPQVVRRLAAFDSILPTSPKTVALGVRDYGAVWTSAFHYLPQAGQAAPPVDTIRPVLLDDKRGWPDVVEDVGAVWADADILMWRQEDLGTNTREICAALSGLDDDMIVVPDGKINARKDDTPRPTVFSDDEKKHLSQRYKRHMRRLSDVPSVRWAVT
ncbi:hypothetical protein L0664_12750 [Octadecabacter sp. G9-8]|uniref:Uncharacterized protein n=1 Tax=Octadecabacter dasysiphoniae TaxID=2909341 RepID=A0ABS9CXF2_9RHOB|nr:hypothetical protein [Octadecabacter dasysiphoniae]MCF2871940.1 hypothetical protein [Octadecabacter dasysiphoniae]